MASWAVPLPQRFAMVRWYGARMLDALRVLCKLDFVVEGLENIPSTPHVVMAKHSSTWETLTLGIYLPPLAFVAKRPPVFRDK